MSVPVSPAEESLVLGETPVQEPGDDSASIFVVLRMVLVLALAALAIYGVVFFIKRLSRPPTARDPHLKILASIPLGGDTFAAVVSVGSKAWLVGGGTGAGVSLISEIDEVEALETMLLDESRKNADAGVKGGLDFKALLNRFGGKSPATGTGLDSTAESLRRQRERLKGLEP